MSLKTGAILMLLTAIGCSSTTGTGEDSGSAASASTSSMNKSIASSYGITSFGGPGDYQAMACGGNSKTANQWYVASSQRYGCHVHLKLTASNGKCVVVSTEDAGPAAYVEKSAGMPILDASPSVGKYLFGDGSLGSSDVRANPSGLSVSAETTSDDVGPCSADAAPTTTAPSDDNNDTSSNATFTPTAGDDDDATTTNPTPTPAPAPAGDDDDDSTSTGQACGSDGQCNPGNDGSGLICSQGFCVAGCHTDAQCPGVTTCQAGQCQ